MRSDGASGGATTSKAVSSRALPTRPSARKMGFIACASQHGRLHRSLGPEVQITRRAQRQPKFLPKGQVTQTGQHPPRRHRPEAHRRHCHSSRPCFAPPSPVKLVLPRSYDKVRPAREVTRVILGDGVTRLQSPNNCASQPRETLVGSVERVTCTAWAPRARRVFSRRMATTPSR